MIKSMTGFGRAERQAAARKLTVEVKSLNSKQLDLTVRVPSIYREKEYDIRGLATRLAVRGKVDLQVFYENIGIKNAAGQINQELFSAYFHQLRSMAGELKYDLAAEPLFATVLRLPEVLQTEVTVVPDEEWSLLEEAVAEALSDLNAFRLHEGAVLMADLLERVSTIETLMGQVVPFESERMDIVRKRLSEGIEAMQLKIDQNRFEQELIYFLEKFDITEEKVRLKQHCDYFRTVVSAAEPDGVGRKLGFITQEIGREINTMGSKANHAEIQKIVVQMKDELEKIKEQLLNLL